MVLAPHIPDREAWLCRQALLEVERRTAPGTPVYLLAWLALVATSPELRAAPVAIAVITVVTTVLTVGRALVHRHFAALVEADLRRARLLLYALVLGSALNLSLVGVVSVFWDPFADSRALVPVIGGVIAAAGTMSMAMDGVLRRWFPLAVLGPYSAALVLDWSSGDVALLVLIALLVAYLARSSWLAHEDWWRAAELSQDQRERATELEQLSITDGLTGLVNRLHFDQRLEAAWAQAQRGGGILSVLLIDLDHFKAINDTFGHATGDTCLEAAAEAIAGCAQRRSDLVARHGGEEFSVLLPDTAQPAARALGELVRQAIEDVAVTYEGEPIPLSASIGVATIAPMRSAGGAGSLVEAADAALYRAKRAGRNRVELAA